MARVPGAEAVYEVADLFRQRCLIEGKSLLWPEEVIWTIENLDSFWAAFVERPDESSDSFIVKLEKQLHDQPKPVHQLAVDIAIFYSLFPGGGFGTIAKIKLVEDVRNIGLSTHQPSETEWNRIRAAFERGIGAPGQHYLTGRPFHFSFYLDFVRRLKESPTDLNDPDVMKSVANTTIRHIKEKTNHTTTLSRNMILHLLFPDRFERIASEENKRRILSTFSAEADVLADIDLDDGLLAIRDHFTGQFGGRYFDFYDEPALRARWDPPQSPNDGKAPDPPQTPGLPATFDSLTKKTHLSDAFLKEVDELLKDKKQLIFEGPPGSGKTFVAEQFARWFTGQPLDGPHDEHLEIVQFHQSYGYEDFVQGIRPETNVSGQLIYTVRDGIFKKLCHRAEGCPDEQFVLLIDEINRGNISRIFGELLLLLEYRDKKAHLPYATGDEPYLSIPQNLYIIGTMNTADRSLAQVDYALRRRFYFVRFMPVENGEAEVLAKWLSGKPMDAGKQDEILTLFVALNREVEGNLTSDYQIGHSYFMHENVGKPGGIDRIWLRAINPLLEEYFHHHRDRDQVLENLKPESLLASVALGTDTDAVGAETETDSTE